MSLRSAFFLLILGFGLTGLTPACTQPRERPLVAKGRPITNGEPDDNPAHAATVALTAGPGTGYFCSGTLISPEVVVTAGHCVRAINPPLIQVFFGDDADGPGVHRPIVEWEVHPDYDPDANLNDIALLRLAEPAPAGIAPVPHLPADLGLTEQDEGVTLVDFSGFGATETGDSGVKLHVSDVIDIVCDSPTGCAGWVVPKGFGYDQDPGGPCSGDSGGPAYVMREGVEYVAGATSYGDQDCAQFGVSTTVDRFAGWIDSFIAAEDCLNGTDDDGDGLVDCLDSQCAGHPECPDACEQAALIGCDELVSGSTAGGSWDYRQYGCLPDGAEAGPEVAFQVDAPAGTQVTADLFPAFGGDLDFFALAGGGPDCDPGDCLAGSFNYLEPERVSFEVPAEGASLVVETWDVPADFQLQVQCGQPEDCANGTDDDGDGLVDCDDPACAPALGCQVDACQAAVPIGCGDTVGGDTSDGPALWNTYSCLNQGTEDGPELAYRLQVPDHTQVTAVLNHPAGSDLDLFLLPAAAEGCDRDACLDASLEYEPPERIEFAMPAGGALLVVETFEGPTSFDLIVTCGGLVEDCGNGVDDDDDLLVDCQDADCAAADECQGPVEDCANGLDDDEDGQVDCDDDDCAEQIICQPPTENCDNGLDDDQDGQADCEDPDCDGHPACQAGQEDCTNGVDDDGDGQVDCDDANCRLHPACQPAEVCGNGSDDDGDDLIDCSDPDCADEAACQEDEEICTNGADDDEDGAVDCDDEDCARHRLCQSDGGGCGCGAGRTSGPLGWLAMVPLLGWVLRRRS